MDGSCSSCGDMTISELHRRLRYVKHRGVPLPLPRSGVRPGTWGSAASGGVRGDLRITVRASPRGVPHPYQPARRFTLPSHVATRPTPPPLESEASEVPSCHPHPRSVQPGGRRAVSSGTSWGVETPSPGGPADLELVRSCSGRPVCISRNHPLPVVLLPIRGNARHGCSGTQLSPGPAQICVTPLSLLAQTLCKIREDEEQVLLVAPYWPSRTWFPGTHAPRDSPSLADSFEEGSAFSEMGQPLAPASRPVETPCVVSGRDVEVLGDLPQEVTLTIASARAPSTRRAYALKWNLIVVWCSSHHEDPRRCLIRAVLSFLQQGLERRLSPSTLNVYVAASLADICRAAGWATPNTFARFYSLRVEPVSSCVLTSNG